MPEEDRVEEDRHEDRGHEQDEPLRPGVVDVGHLLRAARGRGRRLRRAAEHVGAERRCLLVLLAHAVGRLLARGVWRRGPV